MGYYSRFEIRCESGPDVLESIVANHVGFEHDIGIDPQGTRFLAIFDAKWYDFKDNLAKASLDYPVTVLSVIRFGEDRTDVEKVYFYRGEALGAKAAIIYPENPFQASRGLYDITVCRRYTRTGTYRREVLDGDMAAAEQRAIAEFLKGEREIGLVSDGEPFAVNYAPAEGVEHGKQ